MEQFFTKTSLAREAKIDHRNQRIDKVKPVGKIVIGGKTYPIYDKRGIEQLTGKALEQ